MLTDLDVVAHRKLLYSKFENWVDSALHLYFILFTISLCFFISQSFRWKISVHLQAVRKAMQRNYS